ncbi:MAG: hypothetical protein CBB97_07115 [Candidatus Endolissoclinum sp. TMED37]|nr:MAG: hypothetical protein CBB97_07115 [Candidatus Endolissoclinum sp. TMED37]
MKFHNTLIEKLIQVMEVNSGWTGEKKLRAALAAMNIEVYTQQSGADVLVDGDELTRQRNSNPTK